MTVFTAQELQSHFNDLAPGDVVVGELIGAHRSTARLIDLMQQGVVCIPSALAQVLSRSKVAQVEILGDYMAPLTLAVKRRKELLDAIGRYCAAGIGPVVTKEEHLHCGHGVRLWDHIETVYSFRGLRKESYPFVLQPLTRHFKDVRVIIVGDYIEAYERSNPGNFRGNLSSGGSYSAYSLLPVQEQFCRHVIDRAQFPYAHLDLQIMSDGQLYIFEIALNGGIQGSRLDRSELDRRKAARLHQLTTQEPK